MNPENGSNWVHSSRTEQKRSAQQDREQHDPLKAIKLISSLVIDRPEPLTATDPHYGYQWVNPLGWRYILVQDRERRTWSICDRKWDLPATGEHRTRRGAIKELHDRYKTEIAALGIDPSRPIPWRADGNTRID